MSCAHFPVNDLEEPVAASDPAQPNVARIYDYLLGGRFL
jgi:hypothetical protein